MGFLSDLVTDLRRDLAAHPLDRDALRHAAERARPARDLALALTDAVRIDGVALIAEVKRASPSAGSIAADADPVAQARAYAAAGAAAVSVLTEYAHFGGTLDDLAAVRAVVDLPLLRKDFLIDPDQVLAARAAGADAVLLITASVDDEELGVLIATARELGMEPLVESHTDEDLDRALATDARVVGVNARNLETLEVDVAAARTRIGRIRDRVAVFESGIRVRADVERAVAAGASAILVGETLMRAGDPAAMTRALLGREERSA
jgi:indole-3-glycerol phosphate synthase